MSQQKVDRYKEEKYNRQDLMKKEKLMKRVEILATIFAVAAAVIWLGFMAVQHRSASGGNINTTVLSLGAVDNYISEVAALTDDTEEEAEEAAETGEAEESEETEEAAETEEAEETE